MGSQVHCLIKTFPQGKRLLLIAQFWSLASQRHCTEDFILVDLLVLVGFLGRFLCLLWGDKNMALESGLCVESLAVCC